MSVCLLMLIKDESQKFTRAFESVVNLFDSYVISVCNQNGVVDSIADWMVKNEKQGEIIYQEWKDFGHNKSYLWNYARHKTCSYFLFLDPEDVILTNETNLFSFPTKSHFDSLVAFMDAKQDISIFCLKHNANDILSIKPHLARNNQVYTWTYPVFEEISTGESLLLSDFVSLSRKDKPCYSEPDFIPPFLDYLKSVPTDFKAMFYLAKLYETFDKDQAKEWYQKVCLYGTDEYKYLALLYRGRLETEYEAKVSVWMLGTKIQPSRLECYYELMMLEYNKGTHHRAVCLARMIQLEQNELKYDVKELYVEKNLYDWQFDFFLAIACYWAKEYELGLRANFRALRKAPQHISSQINDNLKFFPSEKKINKNKDQVQLIVIDQFYDNPMEIRTHALSQEFEVQGNYPGLRTSFQTSLDQTYKYKQKFESLLGKKITFWPQGYNTSFQYTTSKDVSWIHRDMTEYSAIVFLSMDPPCDSGTLFYRHKELLQEEAENLSKEDLMNEDTYDTSKWELVDQIGNKFNRCIIFRGKRSHIAGKYFGHQKEDGRLFQMFFFDAE
jgi:hypothetical protein